MYRWVVQTSRKVFNLLLALWLLQTITSFIFFLNLDGSLIEDVRTKPDFVNSFCRYKKFMRMGDFGYTKLTVASSF
jgi:hypothetical protein